MEPLVGTSSPANSPSRVDLPDPEAPTMARDSALATCRLTDFRICSGCWDMMTVLHTSRACSTMGVELCAVGECPINYQTPLSEIASYPMLKRLCTIAFVILILPFSSPLWAAVEQKILL